MAGNRRAKHFFEKHTDSARIKCSKESAKKRFLFTLISCPKNGGEKSGKLFFQKHSYNASKQCWEKIVGKKNEKTFLYSHEIRDHKMGGKKKGETIFPETLA